MSPSVSVGFTLEELMVDGWRRQSLEGDGVNINPVSKHFILEQTVANVLTKV